MSASASFLSDPKYGYDFVVAIAQESINSGLKEYMDTIDQPVTYLCFLVDENGNPNECITLDALKKQTGGINPFEIPDGTDYGDPRITALTQARFAVGLKLKPGLPPEALTHDIVILGSSANNVTFNLFLSDFQIIQNNPPSGWGGKGLWQVLDQPSGQPWYYSTKVNLIAKDLDKTLNTPYFSQYPEKKAAILDQLNNLGLSAFSLQQLLFDLDNAAVQTVPSIEGVPRGSNADLVLSKFFIGYYFEMVRAHGEPVLSVHAVSLAPDWCSLRLTGLEREVNQLVDNNGYIISNPTEEQLKAVTLNYLCAVNNQPLPGATTFSWNWLELAEVAEESGIISINRNTLAEYYKNQLLPQVRKSCIKPWTKVSAHAMGSLDFYWKLASWQTPQSAIIYPTGDKVLTISYTSNSDAYDKSGLTAGEFNLHSSYVCDVYFEKKNTIRIVQNIKFWLKVRFDYTSASGNIVDKTITDIYTLSVGQNGQIQADITMSSEDHHQNIDLSGFVDFFVDLNSAIHDVEKSAAAMVGTDFADIPADNIRNFVFPGANVFTYQDIQFSNHQDLLAKITYVKPQVS